METKVVPCGAAIGAQVSYGSVLVAKTRQIRSLCNGERCQVLARNRAWRCLGPPQWRSLSHREAPETEGARKDTYRPLGRPVAALGTNHLAGELRRVDRTRPLQSPSIDGDVALGLAHQLLALAIQLNCHLMLQKGRSTDLAEIRTQFAFAFEPKTLPQVLHSCVEMARDCRFPHLFWCQRCQREVDGVQVTSYPQHSARRFRISCHKSITEFWLTELVIAEHRDVLAPIDTAARASGFSLLRRYEFRFPAPSDREPDQPSVLAPRNPDLPTYHPH
jgi:hypothetical protein